MSYGYYNRGFSPYDFFNVDTRQKVQRLTGGLTSNWTPDHLAGGQRHASAPTSTIAAIRRRSPPDLLKVDQPAQEGFRGVYNANIYNYTSA